MQPDALRQHDLDTAREQTLEQKAVLALDAMEQGLRLKLAALKASKKYATGEELHRAMLDWLCADG